MLRPRLFPDPPPLEKQPDLRPFCESSSSLTTPLRIVIGLRHLGSWSCFGFLHLSWLDEYPQFLLDPLLLEGASNVVFDTLSYSAGPLPEQQLASFPDKPVWIGYGKADPWTPPARVDALINKPAVERVIAWDNIGHCPHDEAPELVNPFLLEFLEKHGGKQEKKDLLSIFSGIKF